MGGAVLDPNAVEQPAEAYIQQVQDARQQDPWVQVSDLRYPLHCCRVWSHAMARYVGQLVARFLHCVAAGPGGLGVGCIANSCCQGAREEYLPCGTLAQYIR